MPDGSSVSVAATVAALRHAGPYLRRLKMLCPPLDGQLVWCPLTAAVRSLAEAAPASLVSLETDAECSLSEVRAMITRDPPFDKLQLRRLVLRGDLDSDTASFATILTDLAMHASLKELILYRMPLTTSPVLEKLVDVVIALGITALHFVGCGLQPPFMAQLARLLTHGKLTFLIIRRAVDDNPILFDPANGPALCAALRSNTTIASLVFCNVGLWNDLEVGESIINALVGHPSIQTLGLSFNRARNGDRAAVGLSLAKLLSGSTLRYLSIWSCDLGDDGMRPIVHALGSNTQLRTLVCHNNDLTTAFPHEHLLPALAANASLMQLSVDNDQAPVSGLAEAEALVAARPRE